MQLYVLNEPSGDPGARALATLAGFAGVEVSTVSRPVDTHRNGHAIHVAATARSLDAFVAGDESRLWLAEALAAPGSSLFLSDVRADESSSRALRTVLPDIVTAIHPGDSNDTEYRIPADTTDGLNLFAGLSFGPADGGSYTFRLVPGASRATELVTMNSGPCYVRIQRGQTSCYLNGCQTTLDIDTPAAQTDDLLGRFLSFVPFLAYLHSTFGERCWHNPRPAACVIIDDPLLKPRYGFLNFAQLEAAIDRSSFSTTIAFIPWNCRRSHPAVARRFTRSDRRLSVCVHGCDHTGAEFGSRDPDRLRSLASRALRSMDTHQQLTGIPHSRVMVFPQGVFSKPSLTALEQEGFVAAVNTSIHPVDAASDEVVFRDLMSVAVVGFDGVPLFMRHYPGRPARFALDLFLGRPVLIVEHHSFFKDGGETLEWYASFLNRIAPRIRWTDLDELCASALLQRCVSSGEVQVQAFSSVVRVTNEADATSSFHVSNRWARADIDAVHWNGRELPFEAAPQGATCTVALGPRETGELMFRRRRSTAAFQPVADPSARERMRVFVRRRLCEFRDNHVATSAALRPLARVIRPVFSRI